MQSLKGRGTVLLLCGCRRVGVTSHGMSPHIQRSTQVREA